MTAPALHRRGLAAALDRLLDPLGPLRTHRFGHDGANDGGGDSEADVLAAVRESARGVHERLGHDHGVFAVELLGATGGGKTALIERLLERHGTDGVAVVAGDVAGTDDADRLREHGVPVVDVTTGRDCHLDPERLDRALDRLDLGSLERLYVENVGNMVCPADFPLGAHVRTVVVSPTEGDDVVRKHPMLFQTCDAAVVNKTDVADAVGADVDAMVADAKRIAPELPVLRTSARTGRGLDDLAALLERRRARHARGHGHA